MVVADYFLACATPPPPLHGTKCSLDSRRANPIPNALRLDPWAEFSWHISSFRKFLMTEYFLSFVVHCFSKWAIVMSFPFEVCPPTSLDGLCPLVISHKRCHRVSSNGMIYSSAMSTYGLVVGSRLLQHLIMSETRRSWTPPDHPDICLGTVPTPKCNIVHGVPIIRRTLLGAKLDYTEVR